MDARFRRSGNHVYMPMCESCAACQPIRAAVDDFQPRADQRRCRTRNRDLTVTFQPRGLDDERLALYSAYQTTVHAKPPDSDPRPFLTEDGGIPGGELHARDEHGTLLAVSIIDVIGDALSSVYCYYTPTEKKRSLGTYMALAEINYARHVGLRWFYLGFFVSDCAKMAYKSRFGPCEVLTNGAWIPYSAND